MGARGAHTLPLRRFGWVTVPGAEIFNRSVWRCKEVGDDTHIGGCGSGAPDDRVNLGTSYCETYRNCGAGVQVELCSIETSQVSYAGGHRLYINPDLGIPQTAWEFLSRFRLPAQ